MLKPKKLWAITKNGKWWMYTSTTKKDAKALIERYQAMGIKHLAIVAVEMRVRK